MQTFLGMRDSEYFAILIINLYIVPFRNFKVPSWLIIYRELIIVNREQKETEDGNVTRIRRKVGPASNRVSFSGYFSFGRGDRRTRRGLRGNGGGTESWVGEGTRGKVGHSGRRGGWGGGETEKGEDRRRTERNTWPCLAGCRTADAVPANPTVQRALINATTVCWSLVYVLLPTLDPFSFQLSANLTHVPCLSSSASRDARPPWWMSSLGSRMRTGKQRYTGTRVWRHAAGAHVRIRGR